ncbi:MAG TPA: hypothetical protein VF006_10740 [Longimicrobium sp.]
MRTLVTLAAVLSLSACSAGKVLEPVESNFLSNGLEQQIRVEPVSAELDNSGEVFNLKSTLVNRGSAPVTVRVVTCWLDPKEHLRADVELVTRAIPSCIPEPNVVTLAPGQASRTLWFIGQFDRPGRHTVHVRHALDPQFWGEIIVRAR